MEDKQAIEEFMAGYKAQDRLDLHIFSCALFSS